MPRGFLGRLYRAAHTSSLPRLIPCPPIPPIGQFCPFGNALSFLQVSQTVFRLLFGEQRFDLNCDGGSLPCHTQEEIAERENIPQRTVADLESSFSEIGNLSESAKSAASHAIDFATPIYNVWKQQESISLPVILPGVFCRALTAPPCYSPAPPRPPALAGHQTP